MALKGLLFSLHIRHYLSYVFQTGSKYKEIKTLHPSPFPNVILVDLQDNELSIAEKMEAHQKGLLHRAFSVCIYRQVAPHLLKKHTSNTLGNFEILLQKRNKNKYHSGGLWSNTCCSHPQPSQDIQKEAERSLLHEMGITATLKEIKVFHYTGPLGNGLIENEIDHVFVGQTEEEDFLPNNQEIEDYQWKNICSVQQDLRTSLDQFTIWFADVFSAFCEYIEKGYSLKFEKVG
jgi:isopentenyl-diphosphate delta-isomerase type 1